MLFDIRSCIFQSVDASRRLKGARLLADTDDRMPANRFRELHFFSCLFFTFAQLLRSTLARREDAWPPRENYPRRLSSPTWTEFDVIRSIGGNDASNKVAPQSRGKRRLNINRHWLVASDGVLIVRWNVNGNPPGNQIAAECSPFEKSVRAPTNFSAEIEPL